MLLGNCKDIYGAKETLENLSQKEKIYMQLEPLNFLETILTKLKTSAAMAVMAGDNLIMDIELVLAVDIHPI